MKKIPMKIARKVLDGEGDLAGIFVDKDSIPSEKLEAMKVMVHARHQKMSQEIQKLALRLGLKIESKTIVKIS